MASSIPAAASGGLQIVSAQRSPRILGRSHGTKIAEAVAPASFTASATVAKTGRPRWDCPAFLGFVPPTTLVPVFLVSYILEGR
jgi:hypothetical protein